MTDDPISCVQSLSACDWVASDQKKYGRDHYGKGQQVCRRLYHHMSLSP